MHNLFRLNTRSLKVSKNTSQAHSPSTAYVPSPNRFVKENLNVDADILNVIVVESYRSKYTEEDIRSDGRLDWVGLSYLLLGLKQ